MFVGSTGSRGAESQPPLTAASISRLGATGGEEISPLHISQLPLILSAVAMTARCSGFNGSDFVNIKLRHGRNISPVVRRSPSIRGENAALQDPLPYFSLCALVRTKEKQMRELS